MHHRWSRHDRGSVTIWLALASVVMVVLVGVAVDLTGQVHAQQRAYDVAAQAARTAGQQVDAAEGVRGISARTNPGQALAAVRAYIEAAGMSGEASITAGGTSIEVTVSDTYETTFLSIIGISTLRVTGTAQARVVRVVGGVER
jgi:Flp pilus assembly protein TadG